MKRGSVFMGACLLSAAVSACDSSSETCAPPGTYMPTSTRSANPGSCPDDLYQKFELNKFSVGPDDRACGSDVIQLSGNITSSTLLYCSYEGTMYATASSDGISAEVKVTFSACPGKNAPSCDANFDIAYTKE